MSKLPLLRRMQAHRDAAYDAMDLAIARGDTTGADYSRGLAQGMSEIITMFITGEDNE